MLSVKSQTFGGSPCKVVDKNHGPHAFNQLRNYRTLKNQMDEYPFGPSSLYSSSCLQVFSFKGEEEPDNQYLAHGDFSGSLKINKIIYDEDQLLLNSENKVYNVKLDRSKEVKVCDEKLKKYSRIFGVATSQVQKVVGLKYWEGAVITKLKSEDDGRIGAEIISRQDVTGKCCCDLGFLDNLDSYLLIDSSGSLSLTDLTTTKCVKRWEDAFSTQVSVRQNCQLCKCSNAYCSKYMVSALISCLNK